MTAIPPPLSRTHMSGFIDGPRPASLDGLNRAHLKHAVYRRVFGDSPPVRIGRYTVLERIARGGMGVVFKAYDTELDRKVAVKVIHIGDTEGAARRQLVQEAQALARLSHPNVVHVYEVGEADDSELFLAMEFIDGMTLSRWCANEKRSVAAVMDVFLDAAEGLIAAHRVGLIHRDFKPDNVLVGRDGRARVVDFGLARLYTQPQLDGEVAAPDAAAPPGEPRYTRVAGTPAYMAPEQFDGGALTVASDQFSFCVALFEALYGIRPFVGVTVDELRDSVRGSVVAVPRARSGVTSAVHRALLQGLASDSADRYPSMKLLLGALRRGQRSGRRTLAVSIAAMGLVGLGVATRSLLPGSPPNGQSNTSAAAPERANANLHEELSLLGAEAMLSTDPTRALAMLEGLTLHPPSATARAARVAAQAELEGLADLETKIPDGFDVRAVVHGNVVLSEHGSHALHVLRMEGDRPALTKLSTESTMIPLFWAARSGASDGGLLIEHGTDETRWLDPAADREVVLPASQGLVHAISADHAVLALLINDNIVLVSTATGSELASFRPNDIENLSQVKLALDATGARVAIAHEDSVVVFDRATMTPRRLDVAASAIAFTSDRLIVAASDGELQLWDPTTGTSRAVPHAAESARTIIVTPDAKTIVSALEHEIEIRDVGSLAAETWPADLPTRGHPMLKGSSDTRWIAFTEDSGRRLRVVELATRTQHVLKSEHTITHFDFTASAQAIVTRHLDGTIRRWPLVTGQPELIGHKDSVLALGFSKDAKSLYSSSGDRTVRRWDIASGSHDVIAEDWAEIGAFGLSADETYLATLSRETLSVRKTGATELTGRMEHAGAFAFESDDTLWVASRDAIVRWHLDTDEQEPVLGDLGRCQSLALSPAGTRVAAVCGPTKRALDATYSLRVWSVPDKSLLYTSGTATNYAGSVQFLGSEDQLLWQTYTGLAQLTVSTGTLNPVEKGHIKFATSPTGDAVYSLSSGHTGVFLSQGAASDPVQIPGTRTRRNGAVAITRTGDLIAHVQQSRRIAFRRRPVPSERAALRSWITQHACLETPPNQPQ